MDEVTTASGGTPGTALPAPVVGVGAAGEAEKPPETTDKPKSLEEALAQLDELRGQIKRVNAESADRRRKLAAYEEAEAKRQQAELSELEKLRVQAAEKDDLYQQAINDLTKLRIRHAIEMAAGRLGFYKPEDAAQLMDWSGLEVDEEQNVKGVEDALKALLKERPYLIRQQQAAPDLNAQQRSQGQTPKAREEELRKRFRIGA